MPSEAFTAAAALDSIVRITETVDGAGWEGTGVLISPDEVLTANHLAYRSGDGGHTATDIEVVPAYQNGVAPFGTYTGTVAHYAAVTNEPIISYNDMQSDYAIIHLSTPVANATVMHVQPDFAGGSVHISGYPLSADGTLIDSVQTVATDPNYSFYDSKPLGDGSSGSPVWYVGADGLADVVGVVSAVSADGATSYDAKLTSTAAAQIAAWVAADDAVPLVVATQPQPPVIVPVVDPPTAPTQPTAPDAPPVVAPPAQPENPPAVMSDGSTGQQMVCPSAVYAGPVAGIEHQIMAISAQNLNILAILGNLFIHTGSGNDAIQAHSGTNVLDGGTGSNFLTAGTGTDTFFVDARGTTADTWSTVVKFHSGDAATLWGVSAAIPAQWFDEQGAAGATGLTLHAGTVGSPTASITLTGFSKADLAAGKVTSSFGTDPASGSAYLYLHAT